MFEKKKFGEKGNVEEDQVFFFLGEDLGSADRKTVENLQRSLTSIRNEIALAIKICKDTHNWKEGRLCRRLFRILDQLEKDSQKLEREWKKALERESRKLDEIT